MDILSFTNTSPLVNTIERTGSVTGGLQETDGDLFSAVLGSAMDNIKTTNSYISDAENEANIAAVRKDVNALMADYPLFAW